MTPMIRTNDPRVAQIMAAKQAQATRFINGRTYRAIPLGEPFVNRFPDGAWAGQPCFIVGGGPSLKGFDFERLRGRGRVIAINKAFYDAPFADIMFAMDHPLIDQLMSGKLGENYKQAFAAFQGVKLWLDLSNYSYPADVCSIPSAGEVGWTKSCKEGLYHGQNSGYGALNLAMVLGADPIYLLGYDCAKGPNGEKNYHEGYPSGGNPNAMKTFKDAFEEGAKELPAGGPRIVNLNPQSALRCFEFGDVDQVLPAVPLPTTPKYDMGVTVITPTGDRPLAFALLRRWMENQTRKPDQWIIIDDGKTPMNSDVYWYNQALPGCNAVGIRREPQPDDPQHTLALNMKAALPYITGDKILICEDDEYYAPGYIAEMSRRLESHEVVGICRSKYYHLPTGGHIQISNTGHASLAETGFRSSFLPVVKECLESTSYPRVYLDAQIWPRAKGRHCLFVDSDTPLYVGIKGLPGRAGIGQGHNPDMYRSKDAADRRVLKEWIPKDHQVYLDIISGKLNSENLASYFPPVALPVTGITVCWNTKDLIERSYNSIRKFYPDMPIIIIDGSDAGDPCATYCKGLASDKTTVIQPGRNIGHGRGMCMGIENAKTPYALIFDSDIELSEPCLADMLAMMEPDTFGVGQLEQIGFDGHVYGVHSQHAKDGPVINIHPYFQLISVSNYGKYYPYVHHGMPTYLTMLDIHKKGLSGKILKHLPGLKNNDPNSRFVRHMSTGTGGMRIARGLSHIEGAWVMNKGLV